MKALRLSKSTGRFDPTAGSGGRRIRERFASRGLKLQFSLPDSIPYLAIAIV